MGVSSAVYFIVLVTLASTEYHAHVKLQSSRRHASQQLAEGLKDGTLLNLHCQVGDPGNDSSQNGDGSDHSTHVQELNAALCKKLCGEIASHQTCKAMTMEKKILSSLWLLGVIETYRGAAGRFGCWKGQLHTSHIS